MADDDREDTPDVDVSAFPGYDAGFKRGYRLGIGRALVHFREALISSGTDPGTAYLLAEKLKKWIEKHGG